MLKFNYSIKSYNKVKTLSKTNKISVVSPQYLTTFMHNKTFFKQDKVKKKLIQ